MFNLFRNPKYMIQWYNTDINQWEPYNYTYRTDFTPKDFIKSLNNSNETWCLFPSIKSAVRYIMNRIKNGRTYTIPYIQWRVISLYENNKVVVEVPS